ncbi:MAG: redoxin family protein [Chloroflexota bacterium]|nr:redoxin family protein [Chloroflexota bacterium]
MRLRNVAPLILVVLLAACASDTTTIVQVPTPTLIPAPTPIDSGMSALESVVIVPETSWVDLPLVDARTGATFRLADFAGKTVYVEPMATWCTNCRAQQNIVRDVRAQVGDAETVFISLSVETALTPADLAAYAVTENYGWTFAVASPDMLQALVAQFGLTISNPPATPHFIISPTGVVSELSTGQHDAAALTNQLDAARSA